jgi:opacity protein-like surface antigen
MISPVAFCGEGLYGSISLGIANLSDSDMTDSTEPDFSLNIDSDPGLTLSGAIGYDFGQNIRLEGEITYQKNDLDTGNYSGVGVALSGDSSSLAFLVNGYYDFKNASPFTPFVTAGIGYTQIDANDFAVQGFDDMSSLSDDDNVFMYHLGAGLGYSLNDKITFDLKYRYIMTSDPDFDTTSSEYSSSNFF